MQESSLPLLFLPLLLLLLFSFLVFFFADRGFDDRGIRAKTEMTWIIIINIYILKYNIREMLFSHDTVDTKEKIRVLSCNRFMTSMMTLWLITSPLLYHWATQDLWKLRPLKLSSCDKHRSRILTYVSVTSLVYTRLILCDTLFKASTNTTRSREKYHCIIPSKSSLRSLWFTYSFLQQ